VGWGNVKGKRKIWSKRWSIWDEWHELIICKDTVTIISEKDNRSKDCNRMEKIKIKRKHNKSKRLKLKIKWLVLSCREYCRLVVLCQCSRCSVISGPQFLVWSSSEVFTPDCPPRLWCLWFFSVLTWVQ
jgi:hypothetical protein